MSWQPPAGAAFLQNDTERLIHRSLSSKITPSQGPPPPSGTKPTSPISLMKLFPLKSTIWGGRTVPVLGPEGPEAIPRAGMWVQGVHEHQELKEHELHETTKCVIPTDGFELLLAL